MNKTSRNVALDAIIRVFKYGDTLDRALYYSKQYKKLSDRERRFSSLILLTTLRRLGEIDEVINHFMERQLNPRHIITRNILRITTAQILFLNTPAYAGVSSAVNLASAHPSSAPLRGFVNAILRRIAEDGLKQLNNIDSEKVNMPPWLWEKMVITHGDHITRKISRAQQLEVSLDLTLKNPKDCYKWADILSATRLPNNSLRLFKPGAVESLKGFSDGAWWVQDAAASLPAQLLGNISGKKGVDLCAAPGGKTAQLLSAGAEVIAVEESSSRLERLKDNLHRLKLCAEIINCDALVYKPKHLVDFVLLDAPCSATGTIRRHPEVPWTRSQSDLAKLLKKQDMLLDAAAKMIAPGGKLVYTVCSLMPEEGVEKINTFLDKNPQLERKTYNFSGIGAPYESQNRFMDLETLPCHWADFGGLDGFFAACLQRRY